METILGILRFIDTFGVAYNFRYRDKKKYKTALGGFILVLFIVLVLVLGFQNFIPFVNRKNYTIVYYTMNLAETEEVNIFGSESNFALGLSCESNSKGNKDKTNIFDLLKLHSSYIIYQKFNNGSYQKSEIFLTTHKCTYKDFYNKYDREFDYLGLSKYECINEKDNTTIEGIYSNEIFSYYEFSVLARNKSDELQDKIEHYLINNDCKLNFAYTDIIIDLDNYRSPITQYLNQIFIQLNPDLYIKRNIYFMNQYFTTDANLIMIYGTILPELKPLYSRYEEYSVYQGLNRKETKLPKFEYFSKIYLRADLKKTIIKRKYQRLMEFYAASFGLLNSIYTALAIIFGYIDYLYGFHSISKFIFFYKELEDKNNFNISKKSNMIKELLSIMNSKNENINKDMKNRKMTINSPPKKKEIENQKVLNINNINNFNTIETNKEENLGDIIEINMYNNSNKNKSMNKKQKIIKNRRNLQNKNLTFFTGETGETLEQKKDNNEKNNSNNYYQGNLQRFKIDQKKKKINSRLKVNFKAKEENNLYSSEKIGTNNDQTEQSVPNAPNNDQKVSNKIEIENIEQIEQINNEFNLFELILTQICRCGFCLPKKLNIKNNAVNKAKKIIFKKLDVVTYIRNMVLFDKINQTIIDDKEKILINFFSRPIISAYTKEEKNEFEEFYENYEDKDFDKYYEQIKELVNKPKKEENDYKLLSISNDHLKTFN